MITDTEKNVLSPSASGAKDKYFITPSNDFLAVDELKMHIEGCAVNNRESQKKIYMAFYAFAMTVCARYNNNRDDAIEILNDGFLKIFKEIHRYKPAYKDEMSSFKGWLAKIMTYTAIDRFRKNQKHSLTTDLDKTAYQLSAGGESAVDRISYREIKNSIQNLTPVYRAVFNLFVIEDFTHEEISQRLGISIGTSKSNLAKARKQLQKILFQKNQIHVLELNT